MSQSEMQKVRGTCPRCGKAPAVRVSVRSSGPAAVTLNLRCEPCYREGRTVYYDVTVDQVAA